MEYVDANVIIYALSDPGLKGIKSKELLVSQELLTNSLTLDEVAFYFLRQSKAKALQAVNTMISSPKLFYEPFIHDDFQEFARLIGLGLKPRDAIHAATALRLGCKVIYSEDKDFDSVKGLKRKTPW